MVQELYKNLNEMKKTKISFYSRFVFSFHLNTRGFAGSGDEFYQLYAEIEKSCNESHNVSLKLELKLWWIQQRTPWRTPVSVSLVQMHNMI